MEVMWGQIYFIFKITNVFKEHKEISLVTVKESEETSGDKSEADRRGSSAHAKQSPLWAKGVKVAVAAGRVESAEPESETLVRKILH